MAVTSGARGQRDTPFPAEEGQISEQRRGKRIDSPIHPIPQLQGPFDESILEASKGTGCEWVVNLDAQSRRRDLLENAEYERLCGRRWRQRPEERYHPFWKLISEISFGIHLLVKGLAKSDTEVLRILQSHVDELDGFLERISDDFLIIQLDLRTRIQYLSLPLQNLDMFDGMLADRNFRLSMISYNDLIEHAIKRFSMAISDTLKDLHKGKEAIGALWNFLAQSATDNTPLPENMQTVYDAMAANIEGWNITFLKLRKKGTALESALTQLGLAVTETQRRVGVASRKNTASFVNTFQSPPRHRSLRGRLFERSPSFAVSEKPLPRDPSVGRTESPVSRPIMNRRMTRNKSVPNLKATRVSESDSAAASAPDCAQSTTGAADIDAHPNSTFPRNLSKKISRIMLPKRSVSADNNTAQNRPTVERPKTSRSRSGSLEQSRALRANKSSVALEEIPPVPSTETSRPSIRQEKMKNQTARRYKTDNVEDVWKSAETKEKRVSRRASLRRINGPLSIFHPKSSNALRTDERPQTAIFENELERQMAWLQEETENLNTYSLKPKRDVAPRFHVLSVTEELEEDEEASDDIKEVESRKEDAESIITALPAFPLPPTAHGRTFSRISNHTR